MVAFCSIVYELIFSQILTVVFGGTVVRYSVTIGLFLFSLGIGSFLFKYLKKNKSVRDFLIVEILLSIIGPLGVIYIIYLNSFASLGSLLGNDALLILSHIPVILVGVLSGFEILILNSFLGEKSFGNILGADYFGSLVGTLVYSLVLYPSFGLVSSALCIGFINIFVASVLFSSKYFKYEFRRWFYISGAVLIFSLIAIFNSQALNESIINKYLSSTIKQNWWDRGQSISQINILEHFSTPYQDVTKYELISSEPELVDDDICLNLDSHVQMCGFWLKAYHNGLVDVPMAFFTDLPNDKKKILIIGGGDFIGVNFLKKYDSNIEIIDHVDIDEEFVEFAKKDPYLLKYNEKSFLYDKLNLSIEDAFFYLKKNKKKYDLILLDLPGVEHDKLMHMYSKEFYTFINKSLSSDGIVVTWAYYPDRNKEHAQTYFNTVSAAGFESYFRYEALNYFYDKLYSVDLFYAFNKGERLKLDFSDKRNKYLTNLKYSYNHLQWKDIPYYDNVKPNSIFEPNYNIIAKYSHVKEMPYILKEET